MKTETNKNSTLYGLISLAGAIVFIGLSAIYVFAPPMPPPPVDHTVHMTYDDRAYPGGFVSNEDYKNLAQDYTALNRRYLIAEGKLPKGQRDKDYLKSCTQIQGGWVITTGDPLARSTGTVTVR